MTRPRNSISFLRFALASLVVYSHACFLGGFGDEWLARWSDGKMIAGFFAVQAFFVLSGCLITESWIRLHSLPRFLWHRGLRLLPALWICLIVTAFVFASAVHLAGGSSGTFWSLNPSPEGYVGRNLFLPRTQIIIGDLLSSNSHPGDWNGSLWTLFYEGACYLGVAALGVTGLLTRRPRWALVLLSLFLAAFVLGQLTGLDRIPTLLRRFFDTPGKELCVDFVAGMIWALLRTKFNRARRISSLVGVVSGIALLALWRTPLHATLSPILITILLAWLAETLPLANWEAWVGGDYSYGIYVYAYPIEQTLAFFGVAKFGFVVFLAIASALTLALAWASWRYVESPALGWKNLMRPKPIVPMAQAAESLGAS